MAGSEVARLWQRRCADEVRRGDERAWARLVREHYPQVYRMLARLCGDAHLAEDLCQETFAAAWSHIGGFAGESAIRTWLCRIAYRKFLDARRACKGGSPPVGEFIRDLPDAAAPVSSLESQEQADALYSALARLDEAARVTLVLHYMQGMSYREMESVTGEPVGTIKWRTKLALEQLGALLGADRGDEKARNKGASAAVAGDALATGPAGA
jgi:RNA polymerase sigma-70 factor (ECF subfamily)